MYTHACVCACLGVSVCAFFSLPLPAAFFSSPLPATAPCNPKPLLMLLHIRMHICTRAKKPIVVVTRAVTRDFAVQRTPIIHEHTPHTYTHMPRSHISKRTHTYTHVHARTYHPHAHVIHTPTRTCRTHAHVHTRRN